jgi:AraC-like DNA-binding protein
MINILIIGVFEGIFLAALLLTKKRRTISDTILATFFLIFSLNIFLSFMEAYNRQNGFPYPIFILTAAPLLLLHGPFLWLYIKSLTDQYFRIKPKYYLNLIPFLALLLQHSLTIYILPTENRIEYVQNEIFKQTFAYPFFIVLIALSPIAYFYLGLRLIRQYKQKIEGYFSQTAGIDLKWLRMIFGSWISISVLINSFFIIDLVYPIAPFGMMQFFSFVIAAIYVIFIGFYGLRQENVFLTNSINLNLEVATAQPVDSYSKPLKEDEKEFIQTLLKHMNEHKPYLQSEITLKALSDELKVGTEYLSEIINNDLNKNFFDFINHYRIEEFKNQSKNEKNKHLNIIGLAFNCGFNSKATFNRVFKNSTGLTPSEYINKSQ